MAGDREDILALEDIPAPEAVEVPEWKRTVYVRTLMGFERDAFDAALSVDSVAGIATNFRAKLVCACLVDEQGNRLFTDADAAALGKKNAKAIMRIFTVAQRVNGMDRTSVEAAAKN